MSLTSAIHDWLATTAKTKANNEAVLAAIPGDPPRGSYYWWAQIARENTGRSLCDSGGIYGYTYERPFPPEKADPVSVNFYKARCEGATISTIHFLAEHLDADTPTAKALEELLLWTGKYLYPRKDWGACLEEWKVLLPVLGGLVEEIEDEDYTDPLRRWRPRDILEHVVKPAIEKMSCYDAPRQYRVGEWPSEEIRWDDLRNDATLVFPYDALQAFDDECLRLEDIGFSRGGYTYNHENDLSQDFVWTEMGEDGAPRGPYEVRWLVIRTHNGCDARGGFSSPVVAEMGPEEYFWYNQAEFYCHACNELWETGYLHGEAVNEAACAPLVIDQRWIGRQENRLHAAKQIAAGQRTFGFGLAPVPPVFGAEIAQVIIDRWHEGEHEPDREWTAWAMVECGETWYPLVDEGESRSASFPTHQVKLWCPECGKYEVVAGAMGL